MQILYCDSCGFRIPERDLTEGRAVREADRLLCEKCRPGKPVSERVSRTSQQRIIPATRSATPPSEVSIPSPVRSTAIAPGAARPQAAIRQGKNSNAVAIGVAAGLLLTAVVLTLAFSGSKPTPAPSKAQTTSMPASLPPPLPHTVPEPIRPKPATEPQPPIQPEAQTAKTGPEQEAQAAFETLARFEGLGEEEYEARIQRIEAYLAQYGNEIVAARARRLLASLQQQTDPAAKQTETAAPDTATTPVAGVKSTARFIKVDDQTKGTWKNAYGKEGYYLAAILDKELDQRGKVAALDLLAKPAWLTAFATTAKYTYRMNLGTKSSHALAPPDGGEPNLTWDTANSKTSFEYMLTVNDEKPHRMALYFTTGTTPRLQDVEFLDTATGTLLDKRSCPTEKFADGFYMHWICSGSVTIRIRKTDKAKPVCSAIFFDAVDGSETPATATQPVVQPPPDAAPAPETALALKTAQETELLAELRAEAATALKAGRFADALAAFNGKAKLPRYESIAAAAAQERSDLESLLAARALAFEELKKQAGKNVTLTVAGRPLTGTVKWDARRNDLALRVAGGAEVSLNADQLDLTVLSQLLPPVEGAARAEDLKRRGLLCLLAGDAAGAKGFFKSAQAAGLGETAAAYLQRAAELELGETEAGAARSWQQAEALYEAKKWKEAAEAYAGYQKKFSSSRHFSKVEGDLKQRLHVAGLNNRKLLPGLLGLYFTGKEPLANALVMSRIDATIDFSWSGQAPDKRVPANNFNTQWNGVLKVDKPGIYILSLHLDDGGRLTLDNRLLIDKWVAQSLTKHSARVDLNAGVHELQVDFYEGTGDAFCRLFWRLESETEDRIVPAACLFHDAEKTVKP